MVEIDRVALKKAFDKTQGKDDFVSALRRLYHAHQELFFCD